MSQERTPHPKVQEALDKLEEGIKQITNGEDFKRWLKVLSQFHTYSWGNVLLIFAQKPDATLVAGFKTWQNKFNRKVNKGAKSIGIFAPMIQKVEENGEEKREIRGFKVVRVFDVSDTNGEPLPVGPKRAFLEGSSDVSKDLLPILKGILVDNDLKYERKDLGSAQGVFTPLLKTISTHQDLDLDMEVKVLTHELIHFLAGHGERMSEYKLNREEVEAVTESTAYVVLDHFGLDSGESSFNYVAGWAKDVEVVKRNLSVIQNLSQHVIGEIDKRIERRFKKVEEPIAA